MSKWKVHRPATRASSAQSKQAATPNRRKTTTGRWTLHDPATTLPPTADGHGWHFDGPERYPGTKQVGQRWTCDYGCKSFVWKEAPQPGQYHAWDCPYWQHEGRNLTPF